MIGTEEISRVFGRDVYDVSGQKIGAATEVYLDDRTGQPEWVTVQTGLFGTKESFAPLRDADLTDDGLRVPVDKDTVKHAPKVDTGAHLSPQEEEDLYRHYGIPASSGTTAGFAGTESDRMVDAEATTESASAHSGPSPLPSDISQPGEDAITRSEERLNVGIRTQEVGRARLRKFVVTESVTETVPVAHEEAWVEREPITEADADEALDTSAFIEEEREVALHAEKVVVEKEAVPVERVRLGTERLTEQEDVSADLRREEIEVEGVDETHRTRSL
jgi:uncharacterized protein (TIGR02271 family)